MHALSSLMENFPVLCKKRFWSSLEKNEKIISNEISSKKSLRVKLSEGSNEQPGKGNYSQNSNTKFIVGTEVENDDPEKENHSQNRNNKKVKARSLEGFSNNQAENDDPEKENYSHKHCTKTIQVLGVFLNSQTNSLNLIVQLRGKGKEGTRAYIEQHAQLFCSDDIYTSNFFSNPYPSFKYATGKAISDEFKHLFTAEELILIEEMKAKPKDAQIWLSFVFAFHDSKDFSKLCIILHNLIASTLQGSERNILSPKISHKSSSPFGPVHFNWEQNIASIPDNYDSSGIYEVHCQSFLNSIEQNATQLTGLGFDSLIFSDTMLYESRTLGNKYQEVYEKILLALFPSGHTGVSSALLGLKKYPALSFTSHICLFKNIEHLKLLTMVKSWHNSLLSSRKESEGLFQEDHLEALLGSVVEWKHEKCAWNDLGLRCLIFKHDDLKTICLKKNKLGQNNHSFSASRPENDVDPFVYIFDGLLLFLKVLEKKTTNQKGLQEDHCTKVIGMIQLLLSDHTDAEAGKIVRKHRGHLWNRLVVDLGHANKNEAAFNTCRIALEDPYLTGACRLQLESRLRSMWAKFIPDDGFGPTPPRMTKDMHFSELVICRQKLQKCSEQRSSRLCFLKENSEPGTVEQVALEYYEKQGWKGAHSENKSFWSLFFLLLWDEIYDVTILGAFYHPFQEVPIDLHKPDVFFQMRKLQINNKLKQLKESNSTNIRDAIQTAWELHFRTHTKVNWDLFPQEELINVAQCLGGKALSKIFFKLASNFSEFYCGFPDLLLWKKINPQHLGNHMCGGASSRNVKLVEVKGPTDSLHLHQMIWLQSLQSYGVPVEICHVECT